MIQFTSQVLPPSAEKGSPVISNEDALVIQSVLCVKLAVAVPELPDLRHCHDAVLLLAQNSCHWWVLWMSRCIAPTREVATGADAKVTTDNETGVRHVLTRNKHDAEAFSMAFAEDADQRARNERTWSNRDRDVPRPSVRNDVQGLVSKNCRRKGSLYKARCRGGRRVVGNDRRQHS